MADHWVWVAALCAFVTEKFDRLDAIVNNACQTVRRPPQYYAHLLSGEGSDARALLPPAVQTSLAGDSHRCAAAVARAIASPIGGASGAVVVVGGGGGMGAGVGTGRRRVSEVIAEGSWCRRVCGNVSSIAGAGGFSDRQ